MRLAVSPASKPRLCDRNESLDAGRESEPGTFMAEVVLVHRAWHGAWCWDGVTAELKQVGVPSTAIELPLTSFAADVAAAGAQSGEASGA